MTVDVIIPSYNSANTLSYAIASCAMQQLDDGDNFTVTVVDDCSTDGYDYQSLIDYWAAFVDIQLVEKDVNAGCGQARQTGMDETDGDFFMFLDADDCLVGPYAIRYLLRAIGNNDLVMGQFIEETANGCSPHAENFTWCHGKLYRRSFIERNLIRFNETRYNEDTAFNQIIGHMTDRIIYIPQTVYSWNNNSASTVRTDPNGYRFGYGWRAFIDNLISASEELASRRINKAVLRDFALDCLCGLFFQYNDSVEVKPEEKDLSDAKLKEFYERAVRPYVLDGAIEWGHLKAFYLKRCNDIVPVATQSVTFKEFLRMLGYYDDMKSLYES